MAILRSVVPSLSARRLGVVLALATVAATSVGCGAAAALGKHHHDSKPTPTVHAHVAGGSGGQQALLNQILAGMGSTSAVSSGTINATPPPNQSAAAGQWLDLTVNEGITKSAEISGEWQAFLVMGAFRDLSSSNSYPVPVGLSTTAVTPSATAYDSGGSTGLIDEPPSHTIPPTNTAALTAQIKSALTSNGLTSTSINYVQPDGTAVVVIASTTTPDQTVADIQQIQEATFGDLDSLEGEYFEVDDSSGAPIWIGAHATRLAGGIEWTSPSIPTPGLVLGPVIVQTTPNSTN
jgi:hypothetical protein